jgi:DNA-binding FadR family transcriptional regulator
MLKLRVQQSDGRRLRRRTLPEQVVDELGQRIVRGDFAASGGLPTEPELSAELGISRNVLREAMKVLASKGLVEVRPKIGTRVRTQEDWNVLDPDVLAWFSIDGSELRNAHDFVEFRRIIEPKASYLAALRATEKEIADINPRSMHSMRVSANRIRFPPPTSFSIAASTMPRTTSSCSIWAR